MAEEHDKTHRLLFDFPRMVEDLIRLCLGGEWIGRLDFSTLEKVPERLLSPELARREQDVLWRLRYRLPGASGAVPGEGAPVESEWFFVYLHVEHMSRPRRLMALDVAAYKMLAWQALDRRKQLGKPKRLPPILSIVFYTGAEIWSAPSSLLELLQPFDDAPEGLDLWSYRLIDAQRFPLESLAESGSPLLGLFRLERLGDLKELPETARELRAALGAEDVDLAAAFVKLINEVALRRLTPEGSPRIRITDLEEVPSMLAQKIEEITHRWELRGEKRGRRKEAAHLFLELFATKYGEVPGPVRKRVASASQKQLETWVKRFLTAETSDDVFD